jgi:hypothetical protein
VKYGGIENTIWRRSTKMEMLMECQWGFNIRKIIMIDLLLSRHI